MNVYFTKVRYSVAIMLLAMSIIFNSNLLLAQNIKSIKTIIKKTDVMGDILEVYTMHGKFYLNQLVEGGGGKENRNYHRLEKIIIDSEKRGKQILIKYRYDKGHGREIVDVIVVR